MSAAAEGFQQILWLFGENDELTEVGTVCIPQVPSAFTDWSHLLHQMNLWIAIKDEQGRLELITPPLEDIILPGVTRDSVLRLAEWHQDPSNPLKIADLPEDMKVTERKITMPEIVQLQKEGRLVEMFGTGTAAVISPIKEIGYKGDRIPVPVGKDGLGDVARAMLREITGRQLGTIKSDWSVSAD